MSAALNDTFTSIVMGSSPGKKKGNSLPLIFTFISLVESIIVFLIAFS